MTDLQIRLERLEIEAAEYEMMAKLAADRAKRELYARLASHCHELAFVARKAVGANH
jgi:hypothetical protein